MHDAAQRRREQQRQRMQGLRWYDRWLLRLEDSIGDFAGRFTSSTVQIATALLVAAVGMSAGVTILVMLFTAEDRLGDAIEAGAITTATALSATTVTSASVALATIADRRRFDLDAISYSRNLTLLLSVHRPATILSMLLMFVAGAHWAALVGAAAAVAWECFVVMRRPEERYIEASNLARVNNKAKWGAVIQIATAAAIVVYCGAHLTGMLLRAGFGVMVRYFFSVQGTVRNLARHEDANANPGAPPAGGSNIHTKIFDRLRN